MAFHGLHDDHLPRNRVLIRNLNALAMEPLGHIAGVGAAMIGSLSSLISIPLGILIAGAFNGTVLPLVTGFSLCGLAVCFPSSGLKKTSIQSCG